MRSYDDIIEPRHLPVWWVRFTEANPIVPVIFAVVGLAWICISIAHIVTISDQHGHGQIVETLGVFTNSQPIVEKAISLRTAYHNLIPLEVRNLIGNLYGNITIYFVVPFILLLELLFPCNPSQPLIGKGFLQDSIWYVVYTPLTLLIIYPIVDFLRSLFEQYLGFLTLDSSTVWPTYLQILGALLLADFFIWLNHYIRHKIPTLWHFHAVHHSQKEMNVFTDDRAHIIDLLVGSLSTFIPFFIFDVSNYFVVIFIGLYKPIHTRFLHANVKINLGWLGLLFTSPQFHRVHHSVAPEHIDKNFGIYFTIFDFLFGTACPFRDVYPKTGITDPYFPSEDKVRVSQLPKNWLVQTVYPFKQLFESVWKSSHLTHMKSRNCSHVIRTHSKPFNIIENKEL